MPLFIDLGRGSTAVPEMTFEEAKELVEILLKDEAFRQEQGGYGNKHVLYQRLPNNLRSSDISERIYAAVKLLMRAGQTEAQACRLVAKILGRRLGKSKRGRPIQNPARRRRSPAETVRARVHSFERINKFPPPEDPAEYIDARVEFWYSYAYGIREWRKRHALALPPGWKASPMWLLPDGSMSNLPE